MSHHVQWRLQRDDLTKTEGRPMLMPSPWRVWKISGRSFSLASFRDAMAGSMVLSGGGGLVFDDSGSCWKGAYADEADDPEDGVS